MNMIADVFGVLCREQQRRYDALKVRYLDYPAKVHLETIAACNASCTFCVYPAMERKGQKMPDVLIDKVIADLTAIPVDVPFVFLPYKVSDPFLESRLTSILKRVNAALPHAAIELVSNGNAMNETKLDELDDVRNIQKLVISLNYIDADRYRAQMGLDLGRTLARLDTLHRKVAAGALAFPVHLRRVGALGDDEDQDFVRWAVQRYPAFRAEVIWSNDWLGDRTVPGAPVTPVPDMPCSRWFDFSVTVTGAVAYCCMDGNARFPKGDVNTQSVLDIYNRPELREKRRAGLSRRQGGDPCRQCNYLQAALVTKS